MSDEIKVAYLTGKTLTANVFKPDGDVRETAISLTENATGCLYIGNCTTIQPGDIIVAFEGSNYIGSREYKNVIVDIGGGADYVDSSDNLHNLRTKMNTLAFAGEGSVVVDHDYGGDDALAYKTEAGVGIDNAAIYAYLKSDYDAGNVADAYIKGRTTTDVNGQWSHSLSLDPETYTLYYFKQGYYGPDTTEVTVA